MNSVFLSQKKKPMQNSDDESWKEKALCKRLTQYFFFDDQRVLTTKAKTKIEAIRELCEVCPVKQECYQYAVNNDEKFGIWGGVSFDATDRRKRRRKKL